MLSRRSTTMLSTMNFLLTLYFFLGILFFYIMYLIWICHIAMKAQKCQHLIASFCVFYEYFIDDVIWLAKRNIYCTICVNTRWCNIIQSASIHRLALWFVFVWLFIFQKCNFIGFRRNILNISLDSLIKYTMNFFLINHRFSINWKNCVTNSN